MIDTNEVKNARLLFINFIPIIIFWVLLIGTGVVGILNWLRRKKMEKKVEREIWW